MIYKVFRKLVFVFYEACFLEPYLINYFESRYYILGMSLSLLKINYLQICSKYNNESGIAKLKLICIAIYRVRIFWFKFKSWPRSKFPLEVKTIGGFLFVFLGDLLKSYTCQCRFQSYKTLSNEIKSPNQIGEGRYKN